MAVIVNLQYWFSKQHSGMLIYFCTKLPTPGATVSVVTAFKPKAKGNVHDHHVVMFTSAHTFS
jgi:hypothetical protein